MSSNQNEVVVYNLKVHEIMGVHRDHLLRRMSGVKALRRAHRNSSFSFYPVSVEELANNQAIFEAVKGRFNRISPVERVRQKDVKAFVDGVRNKTIWTCRKSPPSVGELVSDVCFCLVFPRDFHGWLSSFHKFSEVEDSLIRALKVLYFVSGDDDKWAIKRQLLPSISEQLGGKCKADYYPVRRLLVYGRQRYQWEIGLECGYLSGNDWEHIVVQEQNDPMHRCESDYAMMEQWKRKMLMNGGQKKHRRSLISPKLRYKVMRRDGFCCVLCGAAVSDGAVLEVDHIVPVAKGGGDEEKNLQTLCYECNIGKSDTI